jgi:hypothetical protein
MLGAGPANTGGYVVAYVVIVVALIALGLIVRDPRRVTPLRSFRGAMKPWELTFWRGMACAGIALLLVALITLTVAALE